MLRKAKVLKSRIGYYELNEIITIEDYGGNGVPRFYGKDPLGYKMNCIIPKDRFKIIQEEVL